MESFKENVIVMILHFKLLLLAILVGRLIKIEFLNTLIGQVIVST